MTTQLCPELVLVGDAPAAQQIAHQLRGWIALGLLSPGEELPTVRAMAAGLGVTPAVVSAAYVELERTGYLRRDDGSGFFATRPGRTPATEFTLDFLCDRLLVEADALGFDGEAVLRALGALVERRHDRGDTR